MKKSKKEQRERFWSKVSITGGLECWTWTAATHDRDKYGLVYWNGKMERAHRIAWEIVRGPIPNDANVCHSCDNPPCCNPNHLFLGTKKRNMQDAKQKDRHAYGVRHGKATMDEHMVVEVRRRFAAGVPASCLAEELGVTRDAVYNAAMGRTWKHIPMPPGRDFSLRDAGASRSNETSAVPETCSAPTGD